MGRSLICHEHGFRAQDNNARTPNEIFDHLCRFTQRVAPGRTDAGHADLRPGPADAPVSGAHPGTLARLAGAGPGGGDRTQCINEAGRAVAPVVQGGVRGTVRKAELVHADEISWKDGGRLLWLWVFTCASATLFVVGKRSREVLQGVLGEAFAYWLMTDGYWAYRAYAWRLCCRGQIVRKARGLQQSLDRRAQPFGVQVLEVVDTVMHAVDQPRGGPPGAPLREHHAAMLANLFHACIQHAGSRHEKTGARARELLND